MLATTTNGTATRQTSSSCHDTSASTTSENTSSRRVHQRTCSRPICTSSASESTSEVMRDTSDAGLLPVVERHRQPLQVVEHPHAQVAEEALADARDDHDDLAPVDEVGDDGDQRRRPTTAMFERRASPWRDALVDAVPDEERAGQDRRRPQHDQHAGHDRPRGGTGRSMRGRAADDLLGLLRASSCPPRRRRPHPTSAPTSCAQVVELVACSSSRRPRPPPAPRGRRAGRPAARRGCPSATTRPVVEQHHPVGQGDGGRPVGDHDGGAPAHHLGQGVADLVLLGGVDRRGGVVEDQHPRVGEDGPGDGDALALAARQREAPLADLGGVAVGQRR